MANLTLFLGKSDKKAEIDEITADLDKFNSLNPLIKNEIVPGAQMRKEIIAILHIVVINIFIK